MADGASKKMKIRTIILCSGMLLILGWVLYNLVYRSLVTGADLRARAADQQLRDTAIPFYRPVDNRIFSDLNTRPFIGFIFPNNRIMLSLIKNQ